MTTYDYDLFVIGGGSGGVRAARMSAQMGKRVAIAEEDRFGGTCVIRGCVPKKLYVYASQFPEHFETAAGYGWTIGARSFDWPALVANKAREIARLEGIYASGLQKAGATMLKSRAVLQDAHTVTLKSDGCSVTAEHILIATGARSNRHTALPGHELCITSGEAFDLAELLASIVIAGGGYIAVEFANIFHGLGVPVTLVYRGKEILSRFDADMRGTLHEVMEGKGIRILCQTTIASVARRGDGALDVGLSNSERLTAGQVMLALGREPNTAGLGLEAAGVRLGACGEVLVDDYRRTSIPSIWAIGDVTGGPQLTPVAIHEAMCLVETLWNDRPTKPDLAAIPTAIFSQPEIGSVGLSEEEAAKTYEDLDIYLARFQPMRSTLSDRKERVVMKLIVDARTGTVLGAHVLGADAGEMAQLLAIAVKARLTKDAFDRTMAVHPSAAEELVTMYQPSYRVRKGRKAT